MGPQQLDFIGESGELICQRATLELDGSETVVGDVRFAQSEYFERKLTRHNLSSEDIGLDVTFPEEVLVNNMTNIEVCIKGKTGNYHGIILYKIKDKPVRVGIWLNVSLSQGPRNGLMKITGNAVSVDGNGFGLIIMPLVLVLILGLLILRLKFKE